MVGEGLVLVAVVDDGLWVGSLKGCKSGQHVFAQTAVDTGDDSASHVTGCVITVLKGKKADNERRLAAAANSEEHFGKDI